MMSKLSNHSIVASSKRTTHIAMDILAGRIEDDSKFVLYIEII